MSYGHNKTDEYCKEAVTLVEDLLKCQTQHCTEINALLFNDTALLVTVKEVLPQTTLSHKYTVI